MFAKVVFKNIKFRELQALYILICEYTEHINIKTSDFHDITIGAVLYDFVRIKLEKRIQEPKRKKYKFELPIYQASALYIVLEKHTNQDEFSKHVARKFQGIIQNDFFNRI